MEMTDLLKWRNCANETMYIVYIMEVNELLGVEF